MLYSFFLQVKQANNSWKTCFFNIYLQLRELIKGTSRAHGSGILGSSEILPKWSHSLSLRSVQILETFQGIGSAMPCGCPNKCDPSAYKVGFWRFGFGGKNPQGDPIFSPRLIYLRCLGSMLSDVILFITSLSDLGPWFFWLDPCFGLLGRDCPSSRVQAGNPSQSKAMEWLSMQVRDEQTKVDIT